MKVVINRCFGGLNLSEEAYKFLGLTWDNCGYAYASRDAEHRANPELVACVETLGSKANGVFAELKIVEVPDDVKWEITSYDGLERVEEIHRVWY